MIEMEGDGGKKYGILFIFAAAFHEESKLIGSILDTEADRIFVRTRGALFESDELLIEIIRLQKGSKRESWKDLNGNSFESFGRISFELWTGDYEF